MTTFQEALTHPKVAQALGYAIAKHGDQKYGKDPYSVHLLAVAQIVHILGRPNDAWVDSVIAAALLHDSLEDTNATEDEIRQLFGKEVSDIVKACTKTDKDLCRRCSFKRTVKSLKTTDWALPVKLADRLVNMQKSLAERSSHLNMYVREYAEFKSLLWSEGSYPEFWHELDKAFEAGVEKKK
jgi:guanosine-3',5'-bis(diphosphate) 3'-pyrophosphohydrolase